MAAISIITKAELLASLVRSLFTARSEALNVESEALGNQILCHLLGDRLQDMQRMPAEWFARSRQLSICVGGNTLMRLNYYRVNPQWARRAHRDDLARLISHFNTEHYHTPDSAIPLPHHWILRAYVGTDEPEFVRRVNEVNDRIRAFLKEQESVLLDAGQVLLAVRTDKDLRKVWPEGEKFLPGGSISAAKPKVPALSVPGDVILRLNDAIAKLEKQS